MTTIKSPAGKPRVSLLKTGAAILLGAAIAMSALSQPPPQVGTSTDSQRTFLQFSAGKSLVENHATANAYLKLIDPTGSKTNFVDWLKKAGFISDVSQWTPNGQQTFVDSTTSPNTYGPGMINAFAHIIILNAADLGFIRNQYIRCVPDCKSPNPKIYTYLENYAPTQYLAVRSDGSPDPNTSTTNTPEAVTIALERRSTDQRNGGRIADVAFEWAPAADGSNPTFNFAQTYAYVVQDREVAPFVIDFTNPTNSDCDVKTHNVKAGLAPASNTVDEQYIWPSDGGNDQAVWDCKFNGPPSGTRSPTTSIDPNRPDLVGYLQPVPFEPVISTQKFAAELDSLGTKPSPGLCFMCHGGNIPSTLQSSGSGWPKNGYIKEFRFLPADATNSIFGCDDTSGDLGTNFACKLSNFDNPTYVSSAIGGRALTPLVQDPGATARASDATKSGQTIQMKRYNQAVLITQGAKPPKNAVFSSTDGTITGVGTSKNWTAPKETDDQGTQRYTHGVEVILGWYAPLNNLADLSMSGPMFPDPDPGPNAGRMILQNEAFVPVGWRGTSTGPAQPAGHPTVTPSQLYVNVVSRNCRSCHMNRELSLDFGTEAQFSANQGSVQDYVFQPECDWKNGQVNPKNIVMPAARLTWERFWNGVDPNTNKTLQINIAKGINTSTAVNDLSSQVNLLKAYFGQTPTSYCASQH
jgi:hypothetical protein